MSSLGNLISDVGYAAGDRGSTSVTAKVKNPAIAGDINGLLGDYSTVKSSGDAALSQYISRYLAGYPDAQARTGQEIGAIDQFYNGSAESQLSDMRAQRTKALMDATTRASQYAVANQNRSNITGNGSGSSYNNRVLSKNLTDIATGAAVDNANQERSDWGYLTQNQLALAGQRQKMANDLAGYGLVPENVRRQFYGQDLGYLGQIENMDQANTFYGLQYTPSITEQLGAITGDAAQVAASVYGAAGGGGAGGAMGAGAGGGSGMGAGMDTSGLGGGGGSSFDWGKFLGSSSGGSASGGAAPARAGTGNTNLGTWNGGASTLAGDSQGVWGQPSFQSQYQTVSPYAPVTPSGYDPYSNYSSGIPYQSLWN